MLRSRSSLALESLESRLTPATLSDGGTATLSIALAANESLQITSAAATYDLTTNLTFSDGGVAQPAEFSGFGGTSLQLLAAALSRYDKVQVTDSGAGTSVTIGSGSGFFLDDLQVTQDGGASSIAVQLNNTTFSGSAGLTINSDQRVFIPGTVSTADGGISITASSATLTGVQISGGKLTSLAGSISVNGTSSSGDGGHYGVTLESGAMITASGSAGTATVTVQGTRTGAGVSVYLASSSQVTTNGGNLTISGQSTQAHGVYVDGPSTQVSSSNGAISITGNSDSTNAGHYPIFMGSGVTVSSMGLSSSADVTVSGTGTSAVVGVYMPTQVTVTATGGDVAISGTSANTHGAFIEGPGIGFSSMMGTVSVAGTSSSTNAGDFALHLKTGVSVSTGGATAGSSVTLTGTATNNAVGIYIPGGVSVTTNAGNITVTGQSEEGHGAYIEGSTTLISSTAGAVSVSGTSHSHDSGHYATHLGYGALVRSQGTTSAATVAVTGTATNNALGLVIRSSASILSDTGNLTVTGDSENNHGAVIEGPITLISSNTGALTVSGTSDGDYAATGLYLVGGVIITASGASSTATASISGIGTDQAIGLRTGDSVSISTNAGNLTMMGQSGDNHGALLQGSSSQFSSNSGAISLSGSSSSINDGTFALVIDGSTSVSAQGASASASVTLTGTHTGTGKGLQVSSGAEVRSVGGPISLTGTSTGNQGVLVYGTGALVQSTGGPTATITIDGTSTGLGMGTLIERGKVLSAAGAITINGTSAEHHGIGVYYEQAEVKSSFSTVTMTGISNAPFDGPRGIEMLYGVTVTGAAGVNLIATATGGTGMLMSEITIISLAGPVGINATGGSYGLYCDTVIISGGASVTLVGEATLYHGVFLYGTGTQVTSANGEVDIQGTSGPSSNYHGVVAYNGVAISTLGAGATVKLKGIAGDGIGLDILYGVAINSVYGAITLEGTSNAQSGVVIDRQSTTLPTTITSSGGAIIVNGSTTSYDYSANGVSILGGATLTGFSGVEVTGQAVNGFGILLRDSGTKISAHFQKLKLSATTTNQSALSMQSFVELRSTGSGAAAASIELSGNSTGGTSPGVHVFGSLIESVDGSITLTSMGYWLDVSSSTIRSTATSAPFGDITLTSVNGRAGISGSHIEADAGSVSVTTKNYLELWDSTISSNDGGIQLTSDSDYILMSNTVISGGGAVTISLGDSDAYWAENIRLLNSTQISSTGSSLSISAGDNVELDATSSLEALTTLTIFCDFGGFGDADPGLGGRIDLMGEVTGGTVTLNGGPDADGFKVVPSLTSVITASGNGNASTVAPDALLVATPTGETTTHTPSSATSGAYSTTGGYQDVNYTLMPAIQVLNLEVNTTTDVMNVLGAPLSLRQAAYLATIHPGLDVVSFATALHGQTIDISEGQITLLAPGVEELTTFNGPGASLLSLTTNQLSRHFVLNNMVAATFTGLTFQDGSVLSTYDPGGAIASYSGFLTVTESTFTGNLSNGGGAIFAFGTLLVDSCLFTNNSVGNFSAGGAIAGYPSSALISNSTFTGNRATYGGAIQNGGTMSIVACRFEGNLAFEDGGGFGGGGAVIHSGTLLTIEDSTFVNNSSGDYAGGALILNSDYTIDRSSFIGNTTANYGGAIIQFAGSGVVSASMFTGNSARTGGAISAYGGDLKLINSTISGNTAIEGGGGVRVDYAPVVLRNVTVTLNRADSGDADAGSGGGLQVFSTEVTLYNTIVAGNLKGSGAGTPNDVDGDQPLHANSKSNLIGDAATAGGLAHGVNGNLVGVDPQLMPLADNGGPTQTHAIALTSPALNSGANAEALEGDGVTPLAFDQRGTGYTRIVSGVVDIGAYENQTVVSTAVYADLVKADSPTVYYRLDETSGSTAVDSSGNMIDAAHVSTPTLGLAGAIVSDAASSAYGFDGSGDSLTVPDSAALRPSQLTLEAWVNPTDRSGFKIIFLKSSTVKWDDGYGLYQSDGQLFFFVNDWKANRVSVDLPAGGGSYSHVAATYDGASLRIYLDGLLEDELTYSQPINHSNAPLVIGGSTAGFRFAGSLDELAMYGTALSADRIFTHARTGATSPLGQFFISDVRIVEGDSGTRVAVFSVALTQPQSVSTSVQFATADGSGEAGSDYLATSGTLTFAAGETSKTIMVTIVGDTTEELNETFFVNLSNAMGGPTIGDNQGQGTIVNDDGYAKAVLADGPAAYFQFNETSGGTAYDSSPNRNHGTISPGVALGQAGAPIEDGGLSFGFNSTTGGVVVVSSPELRPSTTLSLEAWVYRAATTDDYDVIAMHSLTNNWDDGYGMYYLGGNAVFYVNHWNNFKAQAPLPLNQWTHLVGTYDGSALRIYVNGVEASSTPLSAPISYPSSVATFRIGVGAGNNYFWAGRLDEVAVYGAALTSTQIADHFAFSAGRLKAGGGGSKDSDGGFGTRLQGRAGNPMPGGIDELFTAGSFLEAIDWLIDSEEARRLKLLGD